VSSCGLEKSGFRGYVELSYWINF